MSSSRASSPCTTTLSSGTSPRDCASLTYRVMVTSAPGGSGLMGGASPCSPTSSGRCRLPGHRLQPNRPVMSVSTRPAIASFFHMSPSLLSVNLVGGYRLTGTLFGPFARL